MFRMQCVDCVIVFAMSSPRVSSVCECQRGECAFMSAVIIEFGSFVKACMQAADSLFSVCSVTALLEFLGGM